MTKSDEAAEAIRALNHLTFKGAGYTWPADVDTVIVDLQRLAADLPQAFHQAGMWLAKALRDGRVGEDRTGASPAASVAYAVEDLAAAGKAAEELVRALRYVRARTSHLTGVETE